MSDTTIILEPISSQGSGGQRDILLDCTGMLETSETLSSATVTSSDDTVLSIVADQVNTISVTADDGTTVSAYKGVQIRIGTLVTLKRDVTVDVYVVGSSGTKETYEIKVPIVKKKTR